MSFFGGMGEQPTSVRVPMNYYFMSNVEKDHEQDATHFACPEKIKETGGGVFCCLCTGHVCKIQARWNIPIEALEDAAAFANFAQRFKMLLWKASEEQRILSEKVMVFDRHPLPREKLLDDVALELWAYIKK